MKRKVITNILGITGLIVAAIFTSNTIITEADSDFSSGDGTKENPYIISNATELDNLRKYCGKDFTDTYFKMDIDNETLDMEGKTIEPICSLSNGTNEEEVFKNAFYGNLDGNNIEIDNLTIETDGISGGLFGATNGSTIENIGMGENLRVLTHGKTDDSNIAPTGGIVGEAWNTTLSNVWNKGIIKSVGTGVGGIVGRLIQDSTIIDVYNTGSITSDGTDEYGDSIVGGIVGYASDNITIENVLNEGSVTATGARVGGIVGNLHGYAPSRNDNGASTLKKAHNTGNVTSDGTDKNGDSMVGGIVGQASDNITIENVLNEGEVKGEGTDVGGVVGILQGHAPNRNDNGVSTLKKAHNTGNITSDGTDEYGDSMVGGIVGYATNNITIENVLNEGSVTTTGARVGGIVGNLQGYSSNSNGNGIFTLKKAHNIGSVTSDGTNNDERSYAGGIVGYASDNITIENVLNEGSVTATGARVGGIVGNLQKNSLINNSLNYNQSITGTDHTGLIVGLMPSDSANTVKNSYTLKENTNLNGIGSYFDTATLENIKGYTAEELKNKDNYLGFDFDSIWTMSNEHAILNLNFNNETTKSDITIKYNDNVIDVENFLYNDGRTYVELNDFCKESDLCTIDSGTKDNKYIIDKNMEVTGDISESENGENIKYTYRVEHEKGTKLFEPSIIIGGRIIDNDVAKQEGDVPSCPEDVENLQCSEDKLYVPVRFLTQSLGLRVEWDGENNTVNIKNNFVETFLSKYDVVTTTTEECDNSNCIVDKENNTTFIEKDNTYYLNVIAKETNENMDYYKGYSFYDSVKNVGDIDNPIFKKGIFTLNGGTMTISENNEIDSVDERNIAQIIVYEITSEDEGYQESDYNIGGYPIVINEIFKCTNCK